MPKWRSFLLAGLLLCAAAARAPAQYGHADTRTSTPEDVMGGRTRWGGDLSYGGTVNGGNVVEDEQDAAFSLFRRFGRSTAYVSGSLIYHTADGALQNNQGGLVLRADRAVRGPWKAFVINTNSYNKFLDLDHRSVTGGGPWYDLILGKTRHGISLAPVYEYERFQGRDFEHAVRLSLRDVSRVPVSSVATLRSDLYYSPKIDDFADYQFFEKVSLETSIWKSVLGMQAAWSYDYDSRPRPGIKRYDTLLNTALTLHFGQ